MPLRNVENFESLGTVAGSSGHARLLLDEARLARSAFVPLSALADGLRAVQRRAASLGRTLEATLAADLDSLCVRLEAGAARARSGTAFDRDAEGLLAETGLLLDRVDAWASGTPVPPRRSVRRGIALSLACVLVLALLFVWHARSVAPWPAESLRAPGTPGGIAAEYHRGRAFESPALRRVDERIDFDRSDGVFAPALGTSEYSVRWSGHLFFDSDGEHAVCLDLDDGGRLWLGGRATIDEWRVASRGLRCARVRVRRGWHPLRVDYFQVSGAAVARLLTAREAHRPVSVVPPERLCCR